MSHWAKGQVWGQSRWTQWRAQAWLWRGSPAQPAFCATWPVGRSRNPSPLSPPFSARPLQSPGPATSASSLLRLRGLVTGGAWPRNLSLLPAGGPGLGPPGAAALTCRHEEDAGTQDDVVSSLIELAGCDAESTHEEQNHTQDREDARGPHSPWRTQWVGRENAMAVR